jgi:hypothetical protein
MHSPDELSDSGQLLTLAQLSSGFNGPCEA